MAVGNHADSNTEHLRGRYRCVAASSESRSAGIYPYQTPRCWVGTPTATLRSQQLFQSHGTRCRTISASPRTRTATDKAPGTTSDQCRHRVAWQESRLQNPQISSRCSMVSRTPSSGPSRAGRDPLETEPVNCGGIQQPRGGPYLRAVSHNEVVPALVDF